MIYEPGQVRAIFPHIRNLVGTPNEIQVFLLGGPADGNEAQLLHEEFPTVTVIGFEPNRQFLSYQQANDFPGFLSNKALWNAETTKDFFVMGEEGRSSRVQANGTPSYQVSTTTVDLVLRHIPSAPVALWIDIERAELAALQGARQCLERGQIKILYLEAFEENYSDILEFVTPYGLHEVGRVNIHQTANDAGAVHAHRFDVILLGGGHNA